MNRSLARTSSSCRSHRLAALFEKIEPRVLMSTNVLNPDGSVMGQLVDDGPFHASPVIDSNSIAPEASAPGFQIQIVFKFGLTPSQQAAFLTAAARWERVLTADLPDTDDGPLVVDDLLIGADGTPIDGVGNILGHAGATKYRNDGSSLPYEGNMEFDTADLANMESKGTLLDVVTHEMGHVLGIGDSNFWFGYGLLQGPHTPTERIFTGPNALNEYLAYGGPPTRNSAGVPVETDGSAGTVDSHWDDDTFGNELMTGYISSSGNPLSRITAASLIDIGYPGVNIDGAESYSHDGWNRAPYIYDFNSNQLTAYPNGNLTMSVSNSTDADGSPLITKFYRESNNIPGLQATGAVAGSPRGSAVTPDTLVSTMTYGVLGSTFNVGNLPAGAYTYYAQSYDIYNEPSGFVSRLINVLAPPPAAPTTPDLLNQLDSGDSDSDNITFSQFLRFTGYAEPNSTVTLSVNGFAFSQGSADGAGFYSVPITLVLDGTYAITAKATNSTGTGLSSAALSVTVDTLAPTVNYGYYERELTQDITLYVSDGRASHLEKYYATLTNLTTGAPGPAAKALSYNVDNSVAQLDFGPIPDGHYRASFPLGIVSDVAGNISPEYDFTFDQLGGDANYDGVVNFQDLLRLSQHYGTSGNYFSGGNFDYSNDGKVTFSDLLILAQHYNVALPTSLQSAAPPAPASSEALATFDPPLVGASMFGTTSVTRRPMSSVLD